MVTLFFSPLQVLVRRISRTTSTFPVNNDTNMPEIVRTKTADVCEETWRQRAETNRPWSLLPLRFIYFSCWVTVRLLILVTLPVAGSVWAWHHPCAIWIEPPLRVKGHVGQLCVSVFVLHQCSCVLSSQPPPPRPTWTSVFIYLNYDYV